jgi:hypothetical protein
MVFQRARGGTAGSGVARFRGGAAGRGQTSYLGPGEGGAGGGGAVTSRYVSRPLTDAVRASLPPLLIEERPAGITPGPGGAPSTPPAPAESGSRRSCPCP